MQNNINKIHQKNKKNQNFQRIKCFEIEGIVFKVILLCKKHFYFPSI